jgi:phosphatidylglycerophosphatase A
MSFLSPERLPPLTGQRCSGETCFLTKKDHKDRHEMRNWRQAAVMFLATGCYVGRIPVAPGTFGSLLALIPCFFLSGLPLTVTFGIILVFIGLAVWVATGAEEILKAQDPGCIVIDEVAGMMVTLAGLPFDVLTVVSGFIVFRILDIIKPFPIRTAERHFSGGTGVVLDDVIAGIMANVLLRAMWTLFGPDTA